MSEVEIPLDQSPADEPAADRPKAPPIESRFLFVDVSALRAKQLRRGAKPRLSPMEEEEAAPVAAPPTPPIPGSTPVAAAAKVKAERVAMEEVREGLVDWSLPDFKAVFDTR